MEEVFGNIERILRSDEGPSKTPKVADLDAMKKGYLSFAIFVLALIAAATFAVRFAFQSEWIWAAGCGLVAILVGRFILLGIYHVESGEAPFFRKYQLKNYYDFRPEEKPDPLRDPRYSFQSEISPLPDKDDNYVGEYKDGKKDGQGTYTWPDADKYVGQFKDDKRHGHGTYTWATGSQYVGEWKDGKPNGQGTKTWPNGTKYVGEYKDGKPHGQSTFTWASGAKYVGEWKDGEKWQGAEYDKDGNVTVTYSEGIVEEVGEYVGELKDGKFHGQGTMTYAIGSEYVGEWKDGKPNGQGTKTWPNGTKYVGEWKHGKEHGQGTYTWVDGEKYVGELKDGENWQGAEYDKDGNVTVTYSEGVEESVN